jgi:hypothetical protein
MKNIGWVTAHIRTVTCILKQSALGLMCPLASYVLGEIFQHDTESPKCGDESISLDGAAFFPLH